MTDNEPSEKPDDRDGVTIDLTKGPEGEEFTYKDYECHITYNGIRPTFKIDGDIIALNTIEDVTGHAGRGRHAWKQTLKEYIDAEHPINS